MKVFCNALEKVEALLEDDFIVKGTLKPDGDLTSLETNVVVMQILDAARQSSHEGRTIKLAPLPK